MSIIEAIEHIKWSINKSPKAYAEMREYLVDLRIDLVNAELRYQEELNVRES